MPAPVVHLAATQAYRLLPDDFRAPDPDHDYTALRLVAALAAALETLTDLLAVAEPEPDGSALLDPQRTPRPYLAWRGAIAGIDITTVPIAAQRDLVADAVGSDGIARRRGSRPAIQAAVNRTLSHLSPPARVWANLGGAQPWIVSVITNTDQTPDAAASLLAALSETPAGMNVELQVVENVALVEVEQSFATLADVEDHFATLSALEEWIP